MTLFEEKLKEAGLTDEEIAAVEEAIRTTCNYCWDEDRPCNCWRDD